MLFSLLLFFFCVNRDKKRKRDVIFFISVLNFFLLQLFNLFLLSSLFSIITRMFIFYHWLSFSSVSQYVYFYFFITIIIIISAIFLLLLLLLAPGVAAPFPKLCVIAELFFPPFFFTNGKRSDLSFMSVCIFRASVWRREGRKGRRTEEIIASVYFFFFYTFFITFVCVSISLRGHIFIIIITVIRRSIIHCAMQTIP